MNEWAERFTEYMSRKRFTHAHIGPTAKQGGKANLG